ncbi:hypothetical protein [Nesterenkonia aurantiaca]|uniref:hypothetical protein n=1 Tax=Nesterenkonia aurantiaca TaxID=1436010 RepID=UPI001060DFDC|nr:hypothetical protein [Nesterenkonia aurantiaca]
MYNLLMGYTGGEADTNRMLEHTSDVVRQYVAPSTDGGSTRGPIRTERLLNLPSLVMPETGYDGEPQIARIGRISEIVHSGRNYRYTFIPNPAIDPIPSPRIEAAGNALDISAWEFHRTHWAVKDVDLYRVLDEHVSGARRRPKVLNFPTREFIEPDLVAVMMPFGAGFQPVYEAIRQGVEASGMRCIRADDIWERDHIMDDVLSLIWRARVVVADLSGKNPNVFYETGIAHTLGRDVILVTQTLDDVPFDLRPIRTLPYHNNGEGRQALAEGIDRRLQTLTAASAS